MDDNLQELKNILQALALPVTGQVHLLHGDYSRIESLAGAFNATYHGIRAGGNNSLTSDRAGALVQLDE